MDQAEILAFITEMETDEVNPLYVAKMYAATLAEVQQHISKQDMHRLLVAGAAMYRNSVRAMNVELQLPPADDDAWTTPFEDERPSGMLH